MDTADFYDRFVEQQVAEGVNDRHRAILGWLRRFGLHPEHRVLEIGCGVGTLTELILGLLTPKGSAVAVDLSPRSIEAAEKRLARFQNVQLLAGDILRLDIKGRFDVVVLPDVIEHIPLESHRRLFERLAGWVAPSGFILLNYPNPHYLEWCRRHRPELLQVIDQPIHADALTANCYPHGLYLDFLKSYSIWIRENDYTLAVLRPIAGVHGFTEARPPFLGRLRRRLRRPTR